MIVQDRTLLIVTNVFDGLFSGGLIMVCSEVTAELAYPVGESISYGFINAIQCLIRFIIKFIIDLLTFSKDWDPFERDRKIKQDQLTAMYITIMIIFLLFGVASMYLIIKAPFVLRRSLADACLEIPKEEGADEISENLISHNTDERKST